MSLNAANTRLQGDVGVACAIAWYTKSGCAVSVPLSDALRYDLVVEEDSQLKRVQVKTTRCWSGNKFVCHLRTSGGNRSGTGKSSTLNADEVDEVFIVDGDGVLYRFPIAEVSGLKVVSLGPRALPFVVGNGW